MPHQCVRCNTFYEDGAKEILKGCSCGAKLFFYIKKKRLEEAQKQEFALSNKEKEQIEKDVYDLLGTQIDLSKPVVLDLESIKILKPGKYELDLVHLFKNDPLIYRLEEGKYMVDLIQTFKGLKKEKK